MLEEAVEYRCWCEIGSADGRLGFDDCLELEALFSSEISSLGSSGAGDNKLRHIHGGFRILILIFLEAAINCDSVTIDKYQYSIEGRGSPILRKVICE